LNVFKNSLRQESGAVKDYFERVQNMSQVAMPGHARRAATGRKWASVYNGLVPIEIVRRVSSTPDELSVQGNDSRELQAQVQGPAPYWSRVEFG